MATLVCILSVPYLRWLCPQR